MKDLLIRYFPEAIRLTEDICHSMGLPFYLIGANATSVILMNADLKPARGTKDIDLAIIVSNHEQYEQVRDQYIENGFRTAIEPFTLYNEKWNIVIDLMPFGGIEENAKIRFKSRETELVVLGYSEALREPEEIVLEELTLKTPTFAGLVMLKLLAFADRPEHRLKDLDDILVILGHYLDCYFDFISENYADIMASEDLQDYALKVSARVVGKEMDKISKQNPSLRTRLMEVLGTGYPTYENKIVRYWIGKGVAPQTCVILVHSLKII